MIIATRVPSTIFNFTVELERSLRSERADEVAAPAVDAAELRRGDRIAAAQTDVIAGAQTVYKCVARGCSERGVQTGELFCRVCKRSTRGEGDPRASDASQERRRPALAILVVLLLVGLGVGGGFLLARGGSSPSQSGGDSTAEQSEGLPSIQARLAEACHAQGGVGDLSYQGGHYVHDGQGNQELTQDWHLDAEGTWAVFVLDTGRWYCTPNVHNLFLVPSGAFAPGSYSLG